MKQYILSAEKCEVENFSNVLRLFDLVNPMIDFMFSNLIQIKKEIKTDIQILQCGEIIYNVKKKFQKCLWIELRDDQSENQIIRNFILHLKPFTAKRQCSKTATCQYSGRINNLRRHEQTCTDEQVIIDQQVDYGTDKTTIKYLVDLGYLPMEALKFRKNFVTTFDIESLEDKENIEDMRNVEAVHRLVSIAASTNRGHSRSFIRKDSSNEAVVKIIKEFLDFLDDLNAEHDDQIPAYFHDAIERLELMCSDESTLLKSDKMKLQHLKGNLEKYLLHDVFGFNSGIFSRKWSFFSSFIYYSRICVK